MSSADQTPSMPPLPDVDPRMQIPYDSIRYVAGYTEEYVKRYAVAYAQAVADEKVRASLAGLRDEIAEFDHKLVSWAAAYPEDVFPKPDLAAVRAALEAAGLSLDCVSAHSMRHVASKLSESFAVVRALARPTPSLGSRDAT